MKQLLKLFIMSSMLVSIVCFAKNNEQSLDQIVAVINDDVVTRTELTHAMSLAKMQMSQEHVTLPADKILQKQVLDQLINKKLQLQIAKQVGINITEMDLDKAIESVAKQNNLSVTELYQRLNSEGMSTTDYRDEIRDQMAIHRLQQQEVVSKINISPQEVDSFMHSQIWRSNEAKEYHIEDILIPLADAPSSDDIAAARKKAETVIAKLRQGQNFQSIAQSESSNSNALQGGDLGWRKLPEIPSAFADQVSHMQAKEIGGPIQAPNGFHIIRLEGVRALEAKQTAPDRKQIENLLLQRKFEEAVQNWVSRLRSQAFITNTVKS